MQDQQVKIFESNDGQASLEVALKNDNVWLSQQQMVQLFDRERSVISKHINNVFKEGELERKAVCAKFAHTASDGKVYNIQCFSLHVVISVGYRVKSKSGVQFRQWATHILKQHIVEGHALNKRRLLERGIEFQQAVNLLSRTLANQQLVSSEGEEVLRVVADYARSWSLLQAYDE